MWTETRVDAPGNTRAHAQNRARAVRALAPIGTPGTRATGERRK